MVKPRVIVIRTAGTNCDNETVYAFKLCKAEVDLIHINQLTESPKNIFNYQILVLPGGFTYGDDIAAGRVLANEMKYRLGEYLLEFIEKGNAILGICNGFQILVKLGLLPGWQRLKQEVTLTWNTSLRFEDRWVFLKVENTNSIFIRESDIITLPVAHGEGRFFGKESIIQRIEDNKQVVFRYVNSNGEKPEYPENPNGSMNDIAGICDTTGRILGMMPHPERFIWYYSHPHWTRKKHDSEYGDGMRIFKNGVEYFL